MLFETHLKRGEGRKLFTEEFIKHNGKIPSVSYGFIYGLHHDKSVKLRPVFSYAYLDLQGNL